MTRPEESELDLDDIQGNIVKAYGRFGFPKARFIFYRINLGKAGRQFVSHLIPSITTSAPWRDRSEIPPVATNIAFTYQGLKYLGVSDSTLHAFPEEFSMGMKARRDILRDDGPSEPRGWDPIWNTYDAEQAAHIMVAINATTAEVLEARYQEILGLLGQTNDEMDEPGAVEQLSGHRAGLCADLDYQDASAIFRDGKPVPEEHFGYTDGISDPYFKGSGSDPINLIGGGKPTGEDPRTPQGWAPLETGEFILGHKDEAFEYPEAPGPPLFSRNGTYMVYRKLHQNVETFNAYLEQAARQVPQHLAANVADAKEFLAAKFAGRWRNGAPLTTFPTKTAADQFINELKLAEARAENPGATAADKARAAELSMQLNAFDFENDLDGSRCPRGAHIRRTNPRSSLQFEKHAFATPAALSNRRRVLRRGLAYGEVQLGEPRSACNHGIIIMLLNADIGRQFEFVQQQWINFGNDFRLANDRDPLLGNHDKGPDDRSEGRMVIEGDPAAGKPPHFCQDIPTFVETRGGDYFFVPSMTCLRMLAKGIVDPT